MSSESALSYRILRTSEYALGILNAHPSGTVHSVYSHTVNLQFGGRLLALQSRRSPCSPISLILDLDACEMDRLPLSEGDAVCWDASSRTLCMNGCRDGLCLYAGDLSLCTTDLSLYSETSTLCNSDPSACSGKLPVSAETHEYLTQFFRNSQQGIAPDSIFSYYLFPNFGGIRELSLAEEMILPVLCKNLNNCRRNCEEKRYPEAARAAVRLLGLGIGLTPAGDDFLCGMLAGLTLAGYRDHPFTEELRREIRNSLNRTNPISAAFLQCALDDQYAEAVRLLAQNREPAEVTAAFRAIGHSSGQDTLCGIRFGGMLFDHRTLPPGGKPFDD